MYYFLKKHRRWIMVVVVTLLMIAFAGMEVIKQWTEAQANPVVARLGEEELHQSTFGDAAREWDMLRGITVRRRNPRFGYAEDVSWVAERLPDGLVAAIERDKGFFFLLAEDARRAGISVPDAEVDELLRDLS